MPSLPLTAALRGEYQELFATCRIRDDRADRVQQAVAAMIAARVRYEAAAAPVGAPWHVVAAIHCLEASLDFSRHLHNGDPLTARTVHVPAGRPPEGNPPFTWEASAADALALKRFDHWTDWTIAGTLYRLEGYNGWGYRRYHPRVLSPYLWSCSQHYTRGKYVADGTWSATAVSRQCGAAVLLRRMAELGAIAFAGGVPGVATPPAPPAAAAAPPLRFATVEIPHARALQEFLNTFPDIFLKMDGRPGTRTSDAFKRVTGHYLHGDSRAQ
jgi:lysozyme family protein